MLWEPYTGGVPAPNPDYPMPLIPAEATIYTQDSTVQIPTLRGIPDGSGGWAARDELVPVPHQPGWYDLSREVFVFEIDDATRIGNMNRYDTKTSYIALRFFPHSTSVADEFVKGNPILCDRLSYIYSAWGVDIEAAFIAERFALDIKFKPETIGYQGDLTQYDAVIACVKAYLKDHPITAWITLTHPTTERIYLDPLKSTPHLTTLAMTGDYPPEVTATAMVSK